MVRVIDLDERGLTAEQVVESVRACEGAILRRAGKVIARIEPADEIDLDDELWARAPEQIARGEAARQRFESGTSVSHGQLKRAIQEQPPA
jgi:hypothetical protein